MRVDWADWLRRWDVQQEGYVPEREARFTAMFDALEVLLPPSFVALDLGGGPGSLSSRLLARFPAARAVVVDVDPVLVAIGRSALGPVDGRLSWLEADLADPGWARALDGNGVDAVLSTTAMHWIPPEPLARLYRDLAGILAPGGLFLNGDHLAAGDATPTIDRLNRHALDAQWTDEAFAARGIETAEQWWDGIRAEPELAPLLAEQARRFAGKERHVPPGLDFHLNALRDAGFREAGTIWQVLSNRVLLAVR